MQGLAKDAVAQEFGESTVFKWRRGFTDTPPNGESLLDVYQRVIPYFEEHIHPRIKDGKDVLIVAHGNTLRSVIKFLERIEDEQIALIDLPTGRPLVYSCQDALFDRIEGEYELKRPLR